MIWCIARYYIEQFGGSPYNHHLGWPTAAKKVAMKFACPYADKVDRYQANIMFILSSNFKAHDTEAISKISWNQSMSRFQEWIEYVSQGNLARSERVAIIRYLNLGPWKSWTFNPWNDGGCKEKLRNTSVLCHFLWLSSQSSKDRKLTNEFRKEVKLPEVNMYIYILYSTEHKQFLLTTATVFVLITHRIAFYSRDMEGPKDLKKPCFA